MHPGYQVVLRIEGTDFQRPPAPDVDPRLPRGSGYFLHDDPVDRPPAIFTGTTTIATGGQQASYLTVPSIRR